MDENDILLYKVKTLIKKLDSYSGSGTSLVSIIISYKSKITEYSKLLTTEIGKAENIKSRVNRQSVISAMISAQQKLKLYNKTPPNGLLIYCGEVTIDGKEKKVSIAFEPHKPINTSGYSCNDKFNIEPLRDIIECNEIYGFIIMDGHGCIFAKIQGYMREIIHNFTVDLPNKHNKGGQSAVRFERLRNEKRLAYLRICEKFCIDHFINPKTNMPNVNGLVLAGHSSFKNELALTIDYRLIPLIKGVYDVAYGGKNGLNETINLSKELLKNTSLVKEKEILDLFFNAAIQDTNKIVYGTKDIMYCLEAGAISILIVYEDLNIKRCLVGETITYKENGNEGENLLEWLSDNYKKYGCELKIVSDCTQEGSQFVNGFGGIGGILRYSIQQEEEVNEEEVSEYSYEY